MLIWVICTRNRRCVLSDTLITKTKRTKNDSIPNSSILSSHIITIYVFDRHQSRALNILLLKYWTRWCIGNAINWYANGNCFISQEVSSIMLHEDFLISPRNLQDITLIFVMITSFRILADPGCTRLPLSAQYETFSLPIVRINETYWNLVRSVSVHIRVLHTYIMNQAMFSYNYFQLHIITLHQHVSVTVWTIIRLSYNNNTNSIHIIVLKPLAVTYDILKRILLS